MRKYNKDKELVQAICNACGKELKVEKGLLLEEIFEGKQTFGYFSEKDGTTHLFDLCEICYDKMVASFSLQVSKVQETLFL